jgi:transposase, IS30 family
LEAEERKKKTEDCTKKKCNTEMFGRTKLQIKRYCTMVYYKRLSLYEREKIYLLQKNNKTQAQIALELSRSQSTISYELNRCSSGIGYLPDRADVDALSKQKRHYGKFVNEGLKNHIISRLKQGWSPEQIAGRLKYERSDFRISHEAIYQYIYSAEGRAKKLSLLLLRRRAKRGSRYGKKPAKHYIPESREIEKRPEHINKRKEQGHWGRRLSDFYYP